MDHKEDRAFMRQFGAVIAGFMVLTVALIFLARYVDPGTDDQFEAGQALLAEKRIVPVGAVRSGEAGAAALAEAQAAEVAAAPAEEVVVDGPAVYGGLCKTCHDAGVAGAPIPGSEDWAARVADKGADGVLANAINGLNAMPPRGGNPALTDEQMKAAVDFMLQ